MHKSRYYVIGSILERVSESPIVVTFLLDIFEPYCDFRALTEVFALDSCDSEE